MEFQSLKGSLHGDKKFGWKLNDKIPKNCNIGEGGIALAEDVHGSAPDIAGKHSISVMQLKMWCKSLRSGRPNFYTIEIGELEKNSYDSIFCMDLDMQNHHSRFDEIVTMYSQSSVDYVSGLPLIMPIERLDCPPFVEESHLTSMPICDNNNNLGKTLSVQQSKNELQPIKNSRKRSIEATDDQKHKKAMCFQEDMEGVKIQRQRVPTKRSQKLTNKITTLQKLVSPYGKGAEKGVDLQRRGLCLVPVSFTQKLIEDCNLYQVNEFLPALD
ncbi:transcription factor bHLH [Forsythia ovata]|uniref:Transcription factor bHLH n=1 Tax=Forsythia ovata TaxID=205694 RepID=A0ABD1WKE1_9LAMI